MTQSKPTADNPLTLQLVANLPVGDDLVFYKGYVRTDLKRCRPSGSDRIGAPTYQNLLEQIFSQIHHLVEVGKLRLINRNAQNCSGRIVQEYVITRIAL